MSCIPNVVYKRMLKVPFQSRSYYKHGYSAEVEAAINDQIQAEQQAAQSYLNIATALLHPSLSRPGAGGYFMRMYHEELQHGEEFIHYQLCRGGFPLIKELCAPSPQPKITLVEAFKQALNLEHNVTQLIEKLISIAENAKDYHCVDFVTSVFMQDQINAINKLGGHLTEVTRISDNEHALWNYDLHLALKYPYKYKSMKK